MQPRPVAPAGERAPGCGIGTNGLTAEHTDGIRALILDEYAHWSPRMRRMTTENDGPYVDRATVADAIRTYEKTMLPRSTETAEALEGGAEHLLSTDVPTSAATTTPCAAVASEAGAVFGAASGDDRGGLEPADLVAVDVVVIAAAGVDPAERRRGRPLLPRTGPDRRDGPGDIGQLPSTPFTDAAELWTAPLNKICVQHPEPSDDEPGEEIVELLTLGLSKATDLSPAALCLGVPGQSAGHSCTAIGSQRIPTEKTPVRALAEIRRRSGPVTVLAAALFPAEQKIRHTDRDRSIRRPGKLGDEGRDGTVTAG